MNKIDKAYNRLRSYGVEFDQEELERFVFYTSEEFLDSQKVKEKNQENLERVAVSIVRGLCLMIEGDKNREKLVRLEPNEDYSSLNRFYTSLRN